MVFHTTNEVRRQIEKYGIIDPARIIKAPLGPAAEYTPEAVGPEQPLPPGVPEKPFLLHVGTTAPRKRIDVLLRILALLREDFPDFPLVKVGGVWSHEHHRQMESVTWNRRSCTWQAWNDRSWRACIGVRPWSCCPARRRDLACPCWKPWPAERRSSPATSKCCAKWAATASSIVPSATPEIWRDTVARLLLRADQAPSRLLRLAQARRFSWQAHAHTIAEAYGRLLGG